MNRLQTRNIESYHVKTDEAGFVFVVFHQEIFCRPDDPASLAGTQLTCQCFRRAARKGFDLYKDKALPFTGNYIYLPVLHAVVASDDFKRVFRKVLGGPFLAIPAFFKGRQLGRCQNLELRVDEHASKLALDLTSIGGIGRVF